MSFLSVLSAPNPLPDPAPSAAAAGGTGTSSNIGFVSVSSLTFPALGLIGFGLIKVLDVVIPSLAGTINAELIAAAVIFLIVIVGEFAFNGDGNNTVLKKVVTVLVGALNAALLLGVYLGILTIEELVTT